MSEPLIPGPSLDAEIAWRVFGLRHVTIMYGGAYELFRDSDGSKDIRLLPPYSTDIAAGWTVVDAMRERGWLPLIAETLASTYEKPEFAARFTRRSPMSARQSTASTPELAICRAALKALACQEQET